MHPVRRPALLLLSLLRPRAAACLCAALLCCVVTAAGAGTFAGKVVTVIDGDTIVVRDERGRRHEVRLAGIDAPEIRQSYGVRSRGHLAELAYGKRVVIAWYKRDKYSRLLGRALVSGDAPCMPAPCGDGLDAGWAQVAAGFAWHDREHLHEQPLEHRATYARAEQEARARRAGLWAESRPLPPWRYRHLHPRRIVSRGEDRPHR